MTLDPRLLDILRCPSCRSVLRLLEDEPGLECEGCGRIYPIVDGIPNMMVESARPPRA